MNQERAFRFGRADHLVGVAGLPDISSETVGIIVLNAGLVHRVGPFRMHAELTRRLNVCGYPTLRFDLSTIGDSSSSGESQTRTQQVCADVEDAMQLLQSHAGCKKFVLIGLCSGAQNAHTVARSEANVVGAIFLDGYAYRTLGFQLRHKLPRLIDPRCWWRFIRRPKIVAAQVSSAPVFAVERLPKPVVRADLADMLDRGLKLYLIYSGGINRYFNHVRQFRECFGGVVKRPGISTAFNREADHTYVLTGDRRRLVDSVERWLTHNFPITSADLLS